MTAGVGGPVMYLGILAAAMIEGEVTYVVAAALVAEGRLNALGVVLVGAAGAAMGDQLYFYLLRRRLTRWLGRFPAIDRRTRPLIDAVRRHQVAMVFLIRFAPGLRIALAAACAYLEVDAVLFSMLNALAALLWAVALLAIVAYVGPAYLSRLGLSGWKGAVASGALIIAVLHILGRLERRHITATRRGADLLARRSSQSGGGSGPPTPE
jgi:membrane protein DedA with SNARE-associated domain